MNTLRITSRAEKRLKSGHLWIYSNEFDNTFKPLKEIENGEQVAVENEKGKPIFSFGKYKGNEVSEVLKNDPGYYSWIMKSDFPKYTKNMLNKIRLSELNNKIS